MDATAWIEQALALGVALGLPLVAAAVGASVLAGAVAGAFGVQEPAVGLAARLLAIVALVSALAGAAFDATRTYTQETWARIGRVGRS